MKRFIFIRHAESQKNLLDITGGKGAVLTLKGISEAQSMTSKLFNNVDIWGDSYCLSSNTPQAIQTAEYISNSLNIPLSIDNIFDPISLGCISGMSNQEIESTYPQYYNQLLNWRSKQIDVMKLSIAGMENPIDAWNRIVSHIDTMKDNSTYFITCTRSIMVLIYNYVHNNHPLGGNYKHQSFSNCAIIQFDYKNKDIAENVNIINE